MVSLLSCTYKITNAYVNYTPKTLINDSNKEEIKKTLFQLDKITNDNKNKVNNHLKKKNENKKKIEEEYNKLKKKGIIVFGIEIYEKYKEQNYKKKIIPPLGWQKGEQFEYIKEMDNGIGILMGEKNGIIGLYIKNNEDWEFLLEKEKQYDQ